MPHKLERIFSITPETGTGGLRMRTSGHPGREIFLSPWVEGMEAFVLEEGGMMPLQAPPEVDLLGLDNDEVATTFFSGIPEGVRFKISRFSFRQLLMLRLVRQSGEAGELLESSPLLLWLLAGAVNPSTYPFEQARAVLRKKRKDILAEVLNVRSSSQVRLLDRMEARTFDRTAFELIVRTLQTPLLVDHLRHHEKIHVPLLEWMLECPGLAQLRLAREENEAASPSVHRLRHAKMLFQACQTFSSSHGEANLLRSLKRCRTVSELSSLHRSLQERYDTVFLRHRAMIRREEDAARALRENVERYERELRELQRENERKRRESIRPGQFPLPPYPGTELIVPIRTSVELILEGRTMDSCVGGTGYVRKGVNGSSAFYRVYYPERCTLELRRSGLFWEIKELKAERNADPRPQTRKFVNEWLAAAEAEVRPLVVNR